MSKVSIALCTYNGADFLPDQLESFLRQTKAPDEIVICDDRSTDETRAVIEVFSRRASFPVHLHINESNLGSTRNFEKAIELCGGDFIFLSDQDDVWNEKKIARMCDEFSRAENIGLVFSNAELVDENLKPLNHTLWDFSFPAKEKAFAEQNGLFELLLKKNVVTGATMAFRRKHRADFLPIPAGIPNMIHDAWITFAISIVANAAFIDEPLIKYRQHRNQQLGIDWKYLQKQRQVARREHYANSIGYQLAELEKFPFLLDVLNSRPQLRKNLAGYDINHFIERFTKEGGEKILHYEARKNLSSSKPKRVIPIFNELLTGRYHRFSKGFASAAKDFLESW